MDSDDAKDSNAGLIRGAAVGAVVLGLATILLTAAHYLYQFNEALRRQYGPERQRWMEEQYRRREAEKAAAEPAPSESGDIQESKTLPVDAADPRPGALPFKSPQS